MERPGVRIEIAGRRDGFSLPEAVISIAMLAIIGSAIISLLRSQIRFYRHQEDVVIAGQNIRALVEALGGDIRMASGPDFLTARADTLALRSDIRRAVVCDSTAPDEAVVFVYDSVSAANLPPAYRGIAISPPDDSTWSYADGRVLTVRDVGAGPRAMCAGSGVPASVPDQRFRRLAGWLSAFPGGAPPAGTIVREYGRLDYAFASAAGRLSLRRNSQELATPFLAGAFTYMLADGTSHASLPPAQFSRLVAVTVSGRATGPGTVGIPARDFTHEIVLRNTVRGP
jgi:type II secretory pathway pseudopilin PulG